MPVSSPYAVFRADDWTSAPPPARAALAWSQGAATRPPRPSKRTAPAQTKGAGSQPLWSSLIQGDLFQAPL